MSATENMQATSNPCLLMHIRRWALKTPILLAFSQANYSVELVKHSYWLSIKLVKHCYWLSVELAVVLRNCGSCGNKCDPGLSCRDGSCGTALPRYSGDGRWQQPGLTLGSFMSEVVFFFVGRFKCLTMLFTCFPMQEVEVGHPLDLLHIPAKKLGNLCETSWYQGFGGIRPTNPRMGTPMRIQALVPC
jgi:hypothetical protein